MSDIAAAANEMRDWADMLKERFPGIAPQIDAKLAEVGAEIQAMFQPMIDYGEGKITREEYEAISAEQSRVYDEKCLAEYGEADKNGEWHVDCAECGRSLTYDYMPSLWPQCSDFSEDCQEEGTI